MKNFLIKSINKLKSMKKYYIVLTLFVLIFTSCNSVRVVTDYDRSQNFSNLKTYAFLKDGVDKTKINDLDKRRILRAIDKNLLEKGFQKSNNPDLFINIFTKERQEINIYNQNLNMPGWGWGWGWGPSLGWNQTSVSRASNGTLYIDIINAKNRELIWQGSAEGILTSDIRKKEERINEFVKSILDKYPPIN
mgnify:CR=1 FL=1